MNRLRLTEFAAHTVSFAAVVATLFVVSVVPGAEANPVSAALIEQVGLLVWAAATPVAMAVAFAALRWARREHESPDDLVRTEHLGGLVAVALAADAVGNAVAIAGGTLAVVSDPERERTLSKSIRRGRGPPPRWPTAGTTCPRASRRPAWRPATDLLAAGAVQATCAACGWLTPPHALGNGSVYVETGIIIPRND